MKQKILFILMACFTFIVYACQDTWLDAKPNKELVVPTTLKDLQALLDNTGVMNDRVVSSLGELSSNDFYLLYEDWQSVFNQTERKAYIWARDLAYDEDGLIDWEWPYRQVYYSNVAIEGLKQISPAIQEQDEWNNVKGSALFYRSWAFYRLAQLFCKPYQTETGAKAAGIPLKLESDINKRVKRATIEKTYQQILNDLKTATQLLPVSPLAKTRPSKPAAYGLIARAYLQMGNYSQALLYADSCLRQYSRLIDYNELDSALDFPIMQFNEEVIFHATLNARASLLPQRLKVDTLLLKLYTENDIRKRIFFIQTPDSTAMTYRGSYDGSQYFFGGVAVDEVLLIRSECYARTGNLEDALTDLNTLLTHRFRHGTLEPFTATTQQEVLEKILKERRKQLLFRGIRWSDLRRLNQDQRFKKTLVRWPDSENYHLEPGDPRYVFAIPQDVINWNNMEQNQR